MPFGFGKTVDKSSTAHQEDVSRAPSPTRVYVPGSPEEQKLLRKIDFRLVPLVWLMYLLSYLDR